MCAADGTPGATGADTAASGHSMRAEGRKVHRVQGLDFIRVVLLFQLPVPAPLHTSWAPPAKSIRVVALTARAWAFYCQRLRPAMASRQSSA